MTCSKRSARLFWTSARSSAVNTAYFDERSSSWSLTSASACVGILWVVASRRSQIGFAELLAVALGGVLLAAAGHEGDRGDSSRQG